jgi:hypothetical protein
MTSSAAEKKEKLMINKRGRKKKKQDVVNETLSLIKSAIENDPKKEVLSYLKDESEKAREHELKMMQMLTQSSSANQPQQPHNMQYPGYIHDGSSPVWQYKNQALQSPNQ